MIQTKATQSQKEWTEKYLAENKIANRGTSDGSPEQQFAGIISQKIIADCLEQELLSVGFDNGIDIELGRMSIDIKTKLRRYVMQPWYAWDILTSQYESENYLNNVYLFCSYNDRNDILTIEGWIPKSYIGKRGVFIPKGAKRFRANGTFFTYQDDVWEIVQAAIFPLGCWEDLKFNAESILF